MARRISENSPVAIRSLIQTLRTRGENGMNESILNEANAQSICYAESDLVEGLRAVRSHYQYIPNFSWKSK
jgi:hypothetical protein